MTQKFKTLSKTDNLAWSKGRQPPGAALHPSREPGELSQLGLEQYQTRHPIPNNTGLSQCQYPIPIPIPVRDEH